MRIGYSIWTIILVFVVGCFVPITTGTTQSNELEKLKAQVEALKRELAKEKEAQRLAEEERRKNRANLEQNKAELIEKQREYVEFVKRLSRLRSSSSKLAQELRDVRSAREKYEATRTKQRHELACYKRSTRFALILMRKLLLQPSVDDSTRIEILRTAARMRSVATPLRPAIQALQTPKNKKLEEAKKKALEQIGPDELKQPARGEQKRQGDARNGQKEYL